MHSTETSRLGSARLMVLYFAALSASLGTAVAAFGRISLYLCALVLIVIGFNAATNSVKPRVAYWQWLIFATIAYMALSILWSTADLTKATSSWTRHVRLLTLPILWLLIKSRTEARAVLRVFTVAQIFVVFSSWLLVWGVPVPWATGQDPTHTYAVFGSYLEQSISEAILVAMLWYQREWILGKNNAWLCTLIGVSTVVHMLGFLVGRTGHIVIIGLLSMAIAYEIPRRYRWTIFLIPFVIALVVFASFKSTRDRLLLAQQEVTAFTQKNERMSSSGERLLFWRTSLQAITEQPILGFGVGSWRNEYKRIAGSDITPTSLTTDNPHQMFLLWAVEGGAVGVMLLCASLVAILAFSRILPAQDARSLQSMLASLAIAGMSTSTIYGIGMGDYFCMGIGILLCMEKSNSANPIN